MLVFLSFNFTVSTEQHQSGNYYFSVKHGVHYEENRMFDEFFLILNMMGENFCVYSIIDDNNHENDEQKYQNANHFAGFALFENHITEHEDGGNRQSAKCT